MDQGYKILNKYLMMQYKLMKKYVSERGKLTLVIGKKIIIALMVCPQEIIETLTLGYPRNGYSYGMQKVEVQLSFL